MEERDLLDNRISTNVRFFDLVNLIIPNPITVTSKVISALNLVAPRLAEKAALKIFFRVNRPALVHDEFIEKSRESSFVFKRNRIQPYKFGNSSSKILLLHGWEGRVIDFKNLIFALIEQGHEVITFDGPGHGYSSGSKTNAAEMAEIASILSDKYGPFEKVIGHSMGGFTAAYAATKYKSISPKDIVVIGTPESLEGIVDSFIRYLGFSPEFGVRIKNRIKSMFGFEFKRMYTSKLLNEIGARTLVVHDLYDRQVNFESAEKITAGVEGAQQLRTSYLGHTRILKDQQTIDGILEWLNYKSLNQVV